MIKVLIVDDERLVRIGVRSSIRWEEYGFTVVGEACNGEEALAKIEALHPHIILTDIRMPKMNGIELLKALEKQGHDMEIIIMSCYNEFDLVRSAMQYGASDYLLKLSMPDDELLEVLKRSQQRILRKREKEQNNAVYDEDDLREKFAKLVLDPETPFSELEHLLHKLHVPLDTKNMALLLLAVDFSFEQDKMTYMYIERQTATLLNNYLHDMLVNQKSGDSFLLDQRKGYILICLNSGRNLDAVTEMIQQKIKEYFRLSLSISILDYAYTKEHLFSCVRKSFLALRDERFLLGKSCILRIHEATPIFHNSDTDSLPKFPISISESLSDIRGIADLGKLPAAIRQLCDQMMLHKLSKNTCLSLFTEIFYKIVDMLHTYGGNVEELNESCGINLLNSLHRLEYLNDVEIWFHTYMEFINNYLTICKSRWKRDEIVCAIDYINNNYHLPITSQKVARIVGISEAYFSTLFKKELRCSFSEYLTELRIEKAKQFLDDPDVYIYEIGEYVGYSDPNYFGKVFKKYSGQSPEAYRKSRMEQMSAKE